MADEHSDVIMMLVKQGQPIAAEAGTDLDALKTNMTKGFKKGYYFELDSFSMQTGTDGTDKETKLAQQYKEIGNVAGAIVSTMSRNDPNRARVHRAASRLQKPHDSDSDDYGKWMNGQDGIELYPVDIQPFKISRAIDKASAEIWKTCKDRDVFDSATLIKRKAGGGPASGKVFLRMDFTVVLVTSISWDQDDPIKENIEFVSRAVTIHYLPQLPDGSLGAPIQAFYTFNKKRRYSAVTL
jgi:type VI protein secretion system component Hcp